MIIYDLECDTAHRFEGWFSNSNDYEQQLSSGLLVCPVCNSATVRKIPSASYINKGAKAPEQQTESVKPDKSSTELQAMNLLQKIVHTNFDDVGNHFAEEAKKIHYGEVEERNIRGTATAEEVTELQAEGISAVPFPVPQDKDKLN